MISKTLKIIALLISLFLANQLQAQLSSATASLERDSLLIGDQVILKLEVSVPAGHIISWPAYEDTLINKIEILEKTGIDTIPSDDPALKTYFQNLLITGFDSGSYYVPPIAFYHGSKDDTITETVTTKPFYIQVHTMEVDTSKAIMPIKPPIEAPITFLEVLPWFLGGLGVILAGLLVFFYLKQRKSAKPILKIRSKPKLPAHVVALNDLEDLRMKKMWQDGKVKEYYSIMTDIVRWYIEERFSINAVEMTTDEIISGMNDKSLESDVQSKLSETLILADLVKFAKEKPLPLDNDNSLSKSIEFVKRTIPVNKETKEETDA